MGGKKTRGQVETEIGAAIIRFEKEFMGRGPTAETRRTSSTTWCWCDCGGS